ncbi:hypothetical protein ACFQDZ_01285 [Sulfitobacter pacificus]|uniref:hypothetical protein n=1 Tax=Sulfitobacter pacificus TaxID=1499314 RepID=UPI0036217E55
MSIQTVTTIITEIDQAPGQLEAAIGTARALDAHLHVLALAIGFDQTAMMGAALDPIPMGLGVEESLERAKALGNLATAQLADEDIRWHVEPIVGSGASSATEIARHTRFSDLVVQHRINSTGDQDRTRRLAETILFEAGVPLLLLPEEAQVTAPPSKILVSWDESATALRAARQALPLLTKASYVHVVMVDPPRMRQIVPIPVGPLRNTCRGRGSNVSFRSVIRVTVAWPPRWNAARLNWGVV